MLAITFKHNISKVGCTLNPSPIFSKSRTFSYTTNIRLDLTLPARKFYEFNGKRNKGAVS